MCHWTVAGCCVRKCQHRSGVLSPTKCFFFQLSEIYYCIWAKKIFTLVIPKGKLCIQGINKNLGNTRTFRMVHAVDPPSRSTPYILSVCLPPYQPNRLRLFTFVWTKWSLLILLNTVEHVECTEGSAQACQKSAWDWKASGEMLVLEFIS